MSKEFFARKKDIDELQINKANASDVYTKEEVINKITEKVSEIVADAPEDFDTLKEMSDWINKHERSAAAMNTAIQSKVDKEEGKSLISDLEIARLADVENYDDTKVKNDIALNRTTLGYQCKNLLKNETGNTVMGGVTFTHNSDGSVTLNGTSDGQYFYTLMSKDFENILGKKCILTGCPANGSSSTFAIYIRVKDNDYIYDSGAGVTFTTDSIIWISIVIRGGVTFNNVTFYPMLRYADIIDDTYEPYQPSVHEQIVGAYFPMTAQKGLGNNTDLNTITEIGNYICYSGISAATMINCPTKAGGFRLIVTNVLESSNNNTTIRYQWIIPNNLNDVLCFRRRIDISADTFSSWYSFGGTVVS